MEMVTCDHCRVNILNRMADSGPIIESQLYEQFRSTIPQRKIVVDSIDQPWILYDAGPRNVRSPLVCFSPVCGTADVFYRQLMDLSAEGYRVISVEYPVYWSVEEFCDGFLKLMDYLQLDKVHIFGASLGAFLGQKVAERTYRSPRVQSLFLCNGFMDTTAFRQTKLAKAYWAMPAFWLKRQLMLNLPTDDLEPSVARSIDFMVEKLDTLDRSQLASRLTMNCTDSYVEPQKIQDVYVTIMDVFDESALSQRCKEEMYKCYPEAKRAHLKSGGNFPYLACHTEVNLMLKIHLMAFQGTRYCAKDPTLINPDEIRAVRGELEPPTLVQDKGNTEDTDQ